MATIKLSNGVLISEESLRIGIDPSNKIATLSKASADSGYTAVQDCWLVTTPVTANTECILKIDNVEIFRQWSNSTNYNFMPIFIHKGSTVSSKSGTQGTNGATVYGTK